MKPTILFFVLLTCPVLYGATPTDSKYALTPITLPGQEAPGTEGGTFKEIRSIALNNRGEVAFGARISGSRFTSGIFLLSDGSVRKIALSGEPAPYVGAEFSDYFDHALLAINDLGQIAFASTLGSWTDPQQVGVFYWRANDIFPIIVLPPVGFGATDHVTGVSLNNKWEIAFSKESGIYLYSNDRIVPIVSRGDRTDATATYTSFWDVRINDSGQIAFQGMANESESGGLFLYSGGTISNIMHTGAPPPGARMGGITGFDYRLDDAGHVLFAPVEFIANALGSREVRDPLYLYSNGAVSQLADAGISYDPYHFALSRSGKIAVRGYSLEGDHVYLLSPGGSSVVCAFYLDGNPPDNAAQQGSFYPVAVNDSGVLVLGGLVFDPGNHIRNELFLAIPINPESIQPDDFDVSGIGGLPMHWSIVWANSGSGDVWRYDSGGSDAYSGSSTLRLHVRPGGGSIFVLSDPVPIFQDRTYAIAVQMRYALPSDSDFVYFTVLQYDTAGNEIAINELDGLAQENHWTWKEKPIWIHTLPTAASLRIRFGLMSTIEAYVDIDALR